jgi:hypothetical protein
VFLFGRQNKQIVSSHSTLKMDQERRFWHGSDGFQVESESFQRAKRGLKVAVSFTQLDKGKNTQPSLKSVKA